MAQINIEIENIKLAEMEVDQPLRYAPFHFMDSQFCGYWISDNNIVFYVGAQTFNCKNSPYNIGIFESILEKYEAKAHTK